MQSTKTKLPATILPFMVEFRPGKDLAYSKVISFLGGKNLLIKMYRKPPKKAYQWSR